MKERIGFVGVGLMGHGMAKNLVDKGWPLTVIAHRKRDAVQDLIARGAREAADLPDLAATSDIIFLCLTGAPEVRATVAALRPALRPGMAIIDCSTSDPVTTDELAREMAAIGVDFTDAPLSRTPKEAWEGTLDAMVGASPDLFARIEAPISAWASRVIHIGKTGDAHRMKLLNNFLALGYGAIYAEALTLAAKVGITPQTFDSVIRGGRMDSGFYQTFMRWPLERDPDAHKFTLQNACKDLRYLESMANAAGVANPVSSAVKNSYARAVGLGGAEAYVPRLIDYMARANGLPAAED